MTEAWGALAEPPHDLTEPLDLPWRDNAWLSILAPEAAVFGTVHVSTSPNAAARRAQCNLNIQGRPVTIAEPLEPGTFTSASIHYGLDGRITVDHADLRMALKLTPRFQLADYTASQVFVPLDEARPLQHFQQGVNIVGDIETPWAQTDVAGCGIRDRTWGFRNETAHITEYISVMACFPERDITVMKFVSPTGFRTHGFSLGRGVDEATEMAVRRDAYVFFQSAELRFGRAVETIEVTDRHCDTWLATGEPGPGPSLAVHDEFVEVRTSNGATGPAVIEQGILHRVY